MPQDRLQAQAADPSGGVRLQVVKPFRFAHAGVRVEEFLPSPTPVLLTAECAQVALAEGWAKAPRGQAALQNKALAAAPENVAATGASEVQAPAQPASGAAAQ